VWAELLAAQHPEHLRPVGEALVRATSRPRREIAIGYRAPVFEHGADAASEQVLPGAPFSSNREARPDGLFGCGGRHVVVPAT
jgi:hypothetical protein